MKSNVKKADDNETDSDQKIWLAIRYLDPDIKIRNCDVAVGFVWIAVCLLIFVFIFLLHH